MPVTVWVGNYVSGKSTALRKRAEELRAAGIEPVTIDYDDLAVVLGSQAPGGHGHAEHFTRMTQRLRGLAIQLALASARDQGTTVLIVDASPTEARWQQYRDAGAEIVTLTVDLAELHRRADAERPEQWHRYIDEWQPTAPDYQPRTHPRPTYRKGAAGRRYSAMRARFLRGKTHCENCGEAFVTNASCQHPACLRHGRGCHQHPRYATVEHLDALVDTGGAGVLDTSRWRAWCRHCNSSLGQATGQRRRTHTPDQGHSLDLDW